MKNRLLSIILFVGIPVVLFAASARIKDFATTATSVAGDDYFPLDGTTEGTRKILASRFLTNATTTGTDAVVFNTSPTFPGNITITGNATPATTTAGTISFDTNAWAASRGSLQLYDGTANIVLLGALASDAPSNGQVPVWNTGGTITWETPSTGSGNVTNNATLASGNIILGGGTTVVGVSNISTSGNATVFPAGGNITLSTSATPSTTTAGTMAFDTNAWAASYGAVQVYNGTANTFLIGVEASDTPANGQVPVWNTDGTITWQDQSGSGGAPTDATYITQTPNGSLSAEQALSALSTGIMRVATTTGVITSLTDSAGIAANISDETGSGVLVFATSPTFPGNLTITGNATPATTTAGTVSFDTNAWATDRGSLQVYDGTANIVMLGALASDTPSNGQVPVWNTGGTITWESTGSGNVTNNATLASGNVTIGGGTTVVGTTNMVWTAANNTLTLGNLIVSNNQTIGNLTVTDLTIAGSITGTVGVTNGGTGRATGTTAYSLVATGTTATGAQQTLANGATTEILVGGGASALPVWTTASGTGAPVRVGSPTFTGNLTLATSATPSTTTAGTVAFDTNAWATSFGAVQVHDGTSATFLVGVDATDTPANGQVPVWNTGGTITWQDQSGTGGAPTDATYITQTPNGSLSAEQALSTLSTGIMRVATTTGVITSLTDSAGIAANISDETGSGVLVFATSPTLVTPTLGVASATSINGLTITSSTGTLTVTNGKTVSVSNTLTLAGTDSTTQTFPSTSQTIVGLTATQTLTGKQNLVSGALGTDDTWEGNGITGLTAGATIAQWEAVYLGGSSTYLLADANGSGTYPAIGLAVAAYSSTDAAVVVTRGSVRNDAWAWTPGGTIYLSATAGGLTQTAPSTTGDKVQVMGTALTADIMFVNPSSDYGTAP